MSDIFRWWEDEEQLKLLARRFEAVRLGRREFLAIVAAAAAAGGYACAPTQQPQQPRPEDLGEKLAKEQVFRTNTEQDPASHDFNKDLYCGGFANLFAGLTMFDPNFDVQPDIAERWEPNADGSVWTFYLRKDSRWSNGDPVTAHDFEWSFKRQLDPRTAAPYAGFLYDLKNAEAVNQKKIDDINAIGVKAKDDYTLVCELEGPRGYWPVLTSYIAALPSHRKSVEKYGDAWTDPNKVPEVVSNGPFKLVRWEHDRVYEVVKNPYYWKAKDIKIERVIVPVIGTAASQLAYENNEIDWHFRVPLGEWRRVQADPKLSKEIIKFDLVGTFYLELGVKHKPWDDKRVRQAVAHAIDRERIVNAVLQGLGRPAYTFNPPGWWGFNPKITKDHPLVKYEGKDAIKYLQGTPYEGGRNWPPIKIYMREEGDAPKAAAQAIIQMLKENLNMNVELEVMEPRAFRGQLWEHKLQTVWIRWYMDYPDPNDQQYLVFYSKFPSGQRHQWSNDEYDKLVNEAKGIVDRQKRAEMYWKADEIMLQDAAFVFVYYPLGVGLLKPRVKGMPKTKDGDWRPNWNIFVRMYDYLYIVEH